VRRQVVWSTSW